MLTMSLRSGEFNPISISPVKLGVFSFSPIAHVCEAVKLGGVYLPMVYTPKFTTSQGATGAIGGLLSFLYTPQIYQTVRHELGKRKIYMVSLSV